MSSQAEEQFLEETGFGSGLEKSQFLVAMTGKLLDEVKSRLRKGEDDKQTLRLLARAFAWLADDADLRFGEWRPKIAESLLAPYVKHNPSPAIQDQLRPFLLQHFGDPRITRRNWGNIADELVQVMFRWLVSLTLDAFFRLLDETALDRHWRTRKTFWSAYLGADLITDAWIVLGPNASRQARQTLRGGSAAAGRLISGYGVLADHSVLLLQLGGATIAEWSHNGKCRLWLSGNKHAPALYRAEYSRHDLVEKADLEQTHRGDWQHYLAMGIRNELGISMSRSAYMGQPRRSW